MNTGPKKASVTKFILDKVAVKTKGIIKNKEQYSIKIKDTIRQQDTTILHLNNAAKNYQTDTTQRKKYNSTIKSCRF